VKVNPDSLPPVIEPKEEVKSIFSTTRQQLQQAGMDYRKAFHDMRKDMTCLKAEAAIIDLQTKHLQEMADVSEKLHKVQKKYHEIMDAARDVIRPHVLESKAGVIVGDFEAKFKKGSVSRSWKSIAETFKPKIKTEAWDEAVDKHTKIGDPNVTFKVKI